MRRSAGVIDPPAAARLLVVLAACLSCPAALLQAGCARGENEAQRRARLEVEGTSPGPVARVKVTQAGAIHLNGSPASLEQLREEFARLKAADGTVWFYRENPQGEPHEQALKVVMAAMDEELPIRAFQTEAEFNQPQ